MNEDWLAGGDDYLSDGLTKLDTADTAIASASLLTVAPEETRDRLARELGIAKNAVLRARRDLVAHRARIVSEESRRRVADYVREIDYGRDRPQLPEFVHLVIPLPLEQDRLAATTVGPREFVTRAIMNRLVNETVNADFARYRDWLPTPSDSHTTYRVEEDFYHYVTTDRRGENLWGIKVYFSGTIAYHWPIFSSNKEIALDQFENALEATITFSERLSDELMIVANRYAVGSVLSNAEKFRLRSNVLVGASGARPMEAPAALVVLPERFPFLSPVDLATKAGPTASEIARILQTRYPPTPKNL